MTTISYPPKPSPGDRIAVVSPSSGLPGILPLPHELGLARLREEYGLEPVEYPTTRKMGSTPRSAPTTSTPRSPIRPSRRSWRRSAATTRSPYCRCWTGS